jgi:hypothetical protein
MIDIEPFAGIVGWSKYYAPIATEQEKKRAANFLRVALMDLTGEHASIPSIGENVVPITKARELNHV